uniref:RNA-dependent RNA polymerase n=1 Tax=Erysiphe necator partitivirus 2 TaxID=2052565 RepID=A0A2I5ARF4_9VIRU|nr:RNA-dependent RNA polymerase [Erysiphe necator partitivirus 2]
MCDTNLDYLGKISVRKDKHRFDRPIPKKTRLHVQKIVIKAIYKYATPELADRVINGYRRSDASDESAEIDFLKTDQPYVDLPRDFHYCRSLRVTEQLFRPSRRLKPISFPDLRYYPWTLNTSAEVPFTNSKYWEGIIRQKQSDGDIEDGATSFHNLYNEVFHINRKHVHIIKRRLPPFWNTNGEPEPYLWSSLHTRAHLVKSENPDKNRAVFGVTKLLLMTENMFIWNLQKEYLNQIVKSPMMWGFETVRGGWMKIWRETHKDGPPSSVLSADWSGFDHKVLHEIIDDVHIMWRNWFDFDQGYEPTNTYPNTTTRPEQIQNLWDWMTYSIKHTAIRCQSGKTYRWKFNGLASGYQQTQLLGSFVNCVMLLTCLSSIGINIEAPTFKIFVQGDDSLVTFNEMVFIHETKPFLLKLEKDARRRFNADLSVEKSFAGQSLSDVEVLSYKNRSGIAYRDEAELLAHLLYPERHRDLAATAASAIGIATAAMGCSRTVYDICHDVYNFIVNELGISPHPRGVHWMTRVHIPISIDVFPSFQQTSAQNWCLTERSKSDNNRLWPTQPIGQTDDKPDGFYFLNH